MTTPPPDAEWPLDPRTFHLPDPAEVGADPRATARTADGSGDGRPEPARPGRAGGASRRRWVRYTAIALAAITVSIIGSLLYAWWSFHSIERVDLGGVASPPIASGTNYLIVGSDSRDGVDPDNANAGVIFGDVSGQRTDTIVVLHVGGDGNRMMALPRDLFVDIAGTGRRERINTAIQGEGGPRRLVETVQSSLGVPIHHYLEVDFAGFLGLVDAVGGITIDFEHPALDDRSGLFVPEAGRQHLDADQALAYVRSRHYVELIDGRSVADPTADLGRVERQQEFLRAVFDKVGGTRNPLALHRVASAMRGNLRIDDDLGFFTALGLARSLRGLDPETVVLPVVNARIDDKSVLLLADEADTALARFR